MRWLNTKYKHWLQLDCRDRSEYMQGMKQDLFFLAVQNGFPYPPPTFCINESLFSHLQKTDLLPSLTDSIVIGFWVGLAVFVIFMFFVLTLLTKTGAPHQE